MRSSCTPCGLSMRSTETRRIRGNDVFRGEQQQHHQGENRNAGRGGEKDGGAGCHCHSLSFNRDCEHEQHHRALYLSAYAIQQQEGRT